MGPKPQRYKKPHQPSGQLTARFLARGTHTHGYGWGPRSVRSGGESQGARGRRGASPRPREHCLTPFGTVCASFRRAPLPEGGARPSPQQGHGGQRG